MIDILLVEDQAILRETLAEAINAQPDMQVVAELADASEALENACRKHVDLALLDVCAENDSSGIKAGRQLKEEFPQIKVVIITGMMDITFVDQARDTQADSFIYKNIGSKELIAIIRQTMEGYSTYPAKQTRGMTGIGQLTDLEIQILRLVCETKSRSEIAHELLLSEGTVKRHISEILAKTGYDSILRLAVRMVSEGLIVPRITDSSKE